MVISGYFLTNNPKCSIPIQRAKDVLSGWVDFNWTKANIERLNTSVHTRVSRWPLSASTILWASVTVMEILVQNPGSAEVNESFTVDPDGDRISPLNVY